MTAVDQRQHRGRKDAHARLRNEEHFEAMAKPFGRAMLESAGLAADEWVLDIGCGTGTSTLDAARLVGPYGLALGIDISPGLLLRARQRAACSGLANVEFVEADAERHRFGAATFDVVISRFGTMLFADPVAAFANVARAVRPGGRLAVVVARDPMRSELTSVAVRSAGFGHVRLEPVISPVRVGSAVDDAAWLITAIH